MNESKHFRNAVILSLVAFVGMAFVLMPSFVNATIRYKVLGDNDFYVSGYLSQKLQFGLHDPKFESGSGMQWYQKDGAIEGATSIISTLFLETQLDYGKDWEFRLGLRGEMDTADTFHDDNRTWDSGAGLAWNRYSDVEDIEGDDSINDAIRECTVAYFSKYCNIRVGKQQVGWGEADGVRLMDVINALDLRKDFILRDSDEGYSESRIPVWMIKVDLIPDFTFGRELGVTNLDLELDWIIDSDVSNRNAVGPREGGPWGFPLPDLPLPLKQLNLPEDDYPDRNVDDSSWGVRLKGILFDDAFFTLNFFYGWQKGFVLTHSGNPAGNIGFITDPNFEGNAADSTWDLGSVPAGMGGSPLDGFFGIGPMLSGMTGGLYPASWYGFSLDLNKKLYRSKIAGFTFSKELQIKRIAGMFGQYTLPVLRVEAAYEWDKPFNVGIKNRATAIYSDWLWVNTIEFRDLQKYLIGLDWNTHIPFINKKDDVWVSAQFTQSHIDGSLYSNVRSSPNPLPAGIGYPGGQRQRLQYAPYFWFPEKWETISSLLVTTAYLNDDLKPQIMWVQDWTYNSYMYKFRVRYEVGDHWRFDVGYLHISGKPEKQFGIFSNNDSFFGIIKYLF